MRQLTILFLLIDVDVSTIISLENIGYVNRYVCKRVDTSELEMRHAACEYNGSKNGGLFVLTRKKVPVCVSKSLVYRFWEKQYLIYHLSTVHAYNSILFSKYFHRNLLRIFRSFEFYHSTCYSITLSIIKCQDFFDLENILIFTKTIFSKNL